MSEANKGREKTNEGEKKEVSSFSSFEKEQESKKKIKNLFSLVILLIGFLLGSIFIDFVQLFSGKGYSQKVLGQVDVFEDKKNDKTWVAYKEPVVEVKVLTVSEEELKDCPACDPSEVLKWMKRFLPTMIVKEVAADSDEGKKIIEENKLNTLPSFVFNKELENSAFYNEEQNVKMLFNEKNDNFVLNLVAMGAPVGKYITTPEINDKDAVIGNKDAEVQIIVYSDYQCPFCSKFFSEITTVAKEFGDKVALTYREFPLDFHAQAMNATVASVCVKEQGNDKFWAFSKLLYGNQKSWEKKTGEEKFVNYAQQAGVDVAKYNKCLEKRAEIEKEIRAGMEEAKQYGISGTPASFIGGEFVSGVLPQDALKSLIESKLGEDKKDGEGEEKAEVKIKE